LIRLDSVEYWDDVRKGRLLNSAQKNVEAIAQVEHKALFDRSLANRISDAITRFAGSVSFLLLHVVWFTLWVGWNRGGGRADPFPFSLLNLIVSLEAVFLSAFVLISQNRMTKQADRRGHLDLQINMLAEEEMTLVLRRLRRICNKLGIDSEGEIEEERELIKKTDPHELMRDLQDKLPE
jgi:uncharacterized membrane protein